MAKNSTAQATPARTVAASKQAARKGTAQATPAKVGKITAKASAQGKPAKPAKAAPASGQQAARRVSQYAGQKIKVLGEKGAAPCRGDAAARYEAITSCRTTDEALGKAYDDSKHGERTITGADIGYLVARGLIELS